MFPAWEWGPCNTPHHRYLTTSYAERLTDIKMLSVRGGAEFRDKVDVTSTNTNVNANLPPESVKPLLELLPSMSREQRQALRLVLGPGDGPAPAAPPPEESPSEGVDEATAPAVE